MGVQDKFCPIDNSQLSIKDGLSSRFLTFLDMLLLRSIFASVQEVLMSSDRPGYLDWLVLMRLYSLSTGVRPTKRTTYSTNSRCSALHKTAPLSSHASHISDDSISSHDQRSCGPCMPYGCLPWLSTTTPQAQRTSCKAINSTAADDIKSNGVAIKGNLLLPDASWTRCRQDGLGVVADCVNPYSHTA